MSSVVRNILPPFTTPARVALASSKSLPVDVLPQAVAISNGGADILVCLARWSGGILALRRRAILAVVALLCLLTPTTRAAGLTGPEDRPARMEVAPQELQGISVTEHTGAQLPLDAAFTDEMN